MITTNRAGELLRTIARQGGESLKPCTKNKNNKRRALMRKSYRVGTHINLRKKEDLFTRISNKIFPYVVAVLATYGFMDILLRANGL